MISHREAGGARLSGILLTYVTVDGVPSFWYHSVR